MAKNKSGQSQEPGAHWGRSQSSCSPKLQPTARLRGVRSRIARVSAASANDLSEAPCCQATLAKQRPVAALLKIGVHGLARIISAQQRLSMAGRSDNVGAREVRSPPQAGDRLGHTAYFSGHVCSEVA